MTKSTNTKKALALSVLSMLVCAVMFVGSTFAWFTDTASADINNVQSGTLDVQLLNEAGESVEGTKLAWVKAAGHEGETVLWEPGCTYELPAVKIKNNGNLALKYKILINGVTGDAKLLEAIDFTYKIGDEVLDLSTEGHLAAKAETGLIKISGHMKETAGNEYQKQKLDGIGIKVVATQDTVEADSKDNQYDADAEYPAASDAELADKLTNAAAGDTVTVAPGTYSLPSNIAEGVTISGEGADKTILKVPAVETAQGKTGLVVNKPGVTISNAEIKRTSFMGNSEYCGFIDIREGGTTLDGVKIDVASTGVNTSAVVIKSGVDVGETVRIANCSLNGRFKTVDIVDGVNGTVEIDNTEITGIYTFNVNSASSQNLVINVTDSKLHGWTSYGDIKSASFVNTEFSKGGSAYNYMRPYADTTLTNCTFGEGFKLGAGEVGKTYTINNCTINGTKLTAENIRELMLDEGNIDNLRGCTIIVDGKTVTLS